MVVKKQVIKPYLIITRDQNDPVGNSWLVQLNKCITTSTAKTDKPKSLHPNSVFSTMHWFYHLWNGSNNPKALRELNVISLQELSHSAWGTWLNGTSYYASIYYSKLIIKKKTKEQKYPISFFLTYCFWSLGPVFSTWKLFSDSLLHLLLYLLFVKWWVEITENIIWILFKY